MRITKRNLHAFSEGSSEFPLHPGKELTSKRVQPEKLMNSKDVNRKTVRSKMGEP
jgi:hypothetical protein